MAERLAGRWRRRRLIAFCRALVGSRERGNALAAAVLDAGPAQGVAGRRLALYRRAVELCGHEPADPRDAAGIVADLARLPTRQRAALLLRHAERLSLSQTATVLDASAADLRWLLVTARLALAGEGAGAVPGDHTIDSSVNWVESRAAQSA